MKKVIVNNDKIRVTANGQSIVEGSFARVTEIRGKSVKNNNLFYLSGSFPLSTSNGGVVLESNKLGIYTVDANNYATTNYVYFNPLSCVLKAGTYCYSNLFNDYDEKVLHYLTFGSALNLDLEKNAYIKNESGTYILYPSKNPKKRTFTLENDTTVYFNIRIGEKRTEKIVFIPMINEGETPLPLQPFGRTQGEIIDSKIKGILSHNRNLLSKDQSMLISDGYAGSAYFSDTLIDLLNLRNVNSLSASCNYKSNTIVWKNENPRIGIKTGKVNGKSNSTSKNYETYNGIIQKRNVTLDLNEDDVYSGGVVWYNDFGSLPLGCSRDNSFISYQNQLEIGDKPTRYVESEEYEYNLPSEITLRSSIDNESIYDVYYPEQGLIIRCINEDGTIKSTPIFEDITPTAYNGYKAFNNGFEKLISSVDSNNLTLYDYGAIPEIVVEYEVEPKQGADRTRFDFITLDGEAICGIGYEKLKSTNQLQYVEEPDRQNDGSMSNIEDYDTFVLPALEVGFNCINEETYRRLKHKLISKRTFDVGYYDKDLDKVVTMEMYVKPIDLDNFLSYGDDIIGMNFSISFVPTLNEETKYKVTFLNYDYTTIIKEYSGNNGVLYGRAIETPPVPSEYNYWLMIESGFKENTYVKIKGNKKLSIFGNTKLIAVK